ncbi:MAG: ABC transporter permease [Anaerolineae bacterium]|nr:ABC transporter permease [Anaerolineae bacterium]
MRNLIVVTLNELRVNFTDANTLFFLVLMPIILTLVIGFGLGNMTGGATVIPLDVVDLDGSELSARLVETLRTLAADTPLRLCVLTDTTGAEQPEACGLPATTELADLTPDELASQRVRDNDTYAAVIIPEGFQAKLMAGEDAAVAYRANASFSAPAIIRQTVDAAVSRASGSVVAARLSVNAARAEDAIPAADAEAFFGEVYQAAEIQWEAPPAVLKAEATLQGEEDGFTAAGGGFSQSAPGMACMFVMMNVLGISESLIRARQEWTLQRLMTLPVPRAVFTAGKLLAYFITGFAQFVLLVVFGGVLGVNYGGNFPAIIVLAAVYTFTVTAMGLAFATFVRTMGQANALGVLLGTILSPLGGAWWPLNIVPQAMNVVGHILSPIAWAMDAFHDMIYYAKGLVDILPYLGILLVYAGVFFVVGVWRFRYE